MRRAIVASLAALAPALGEPLPAQGVRITGTTITRYVEVRPLVADSVPLDSTRGTGIVREATTRPVAVQCLPGDFYCRYRRSADGSEAVVTAIQDIEASAWGFGRGVRGYAHLRGRAATGASRELWPQADDPLDVLDAYIEVDRGRIRGRAGRQWSTTGLGYHNFDGASLLVRATERISVEAFGGWSLLRGLNESHTGGAIAAVETIPPEDRALLLGLTLQGRPTPALSVAGSYQREVNTDRSAFYSERVAADAELRLGLAAAVSASLEADLATAEVNEALLRGRVRLPRRFELVAEARRHLPFFELWTIWGAFSPIGFTEAQAAASWRDAASRLLVQARGGWRRYDETDAGVGFLPLERTGWRIGANGSWRVAERWTLFAAGHNELGFGAARSDVDAGARWEPSPRGYAGVRVAGFQSAYELRVGRGRVFALGVDGGFRLGEEMRIAGDLTTYRHAYSDLAPSTDWSQTRASLRLEWTVGGDPGEDGTPEGGS